MKTLSRVSSHLGLRSLLVFTLALHFAGFYQLIIPAYQDGILFISRKWWVLGVACSLLILLDLIFVILSWTKAANWIEDRIRIAVRRLAFLGWLNVIIYAVAAAVLTYLVYGISWGLVPLGSLTILAMFWSVALAGCLFLRASIKPDHPLSQVPWVGYLGISVLLSAFTYRISSFFPDISSYPFTLTWSETSRYYYASLFFAKEIYGFAIPPTVLHPSRYLLQSLPFLLPDSPLWLHRTWQVILWVGFTLVTSLVVVRRLSIRNRLWQWLSVLWIFLVFIDRSRLLPSSSPGHPGLFRFQQVRDRVDQETKFYLLYQHTSGQRLGGYQPGELVSGARYAGCYTVVARGSFSALNGFR